jgi:hypothetical protein
VCFLSSLAIDIYIYIIVYIYIYHIQTQPSRRVRSFSTHCPWASCRAAWMRTMRRAWCWAGRKLYKGTLMDTMWRIPWWTLYQMSIGYSDSLIFRDN